ncbi:SDR family NAD(P)-dependent oxidoreductase [Hymenobacter sp. YC55]|uniref:SDR family NAD(P)-dependent oxidoreductase n=1 Tax=Hymenobacter sp. YC55 TaxID=3034019 RepID=UPI0023F9F56B|nr:SDR family NAD(P)-dependent oxidoreductase [Hymenobacter sp. YC55]MDF7815771.1 SDR family NAD(P)-dependent oxidoreductase [Hymenobacter sp. YC55]
MPTIFITGASSGLGKATAKLFAARGWNVLATMRHPERETELPQLPGVHLLPLDVTDPTQIADTVQRALALHPVDVVFNNAGYGLIGALEALSDEHITQLVSTNLLGVIRVTKAFLPHLRAQRSGRILNTTSMGGFLAFPLCSIYHATKFLHPRHSLGRPADGVAPATLAARRRPVVGPRRGNKAEEKKPLAHGKRVERLGVQPDERQGACPRSPGSVPPTRQPVSRKLERLRQPGGGLAKNRQAERSPACRWTTSRSPSTPIITTEKKSQSV